MEKPAPVRPIDNKLLPEEWDLFADKRKGTPLRPNVFYVGVSIVRPGRPVWPSQRLYPCRGKGALGRKEEKEGPRECSGKRGDIDSKKKKKRVKEGENKPPGTIGTLSPRWGGELQRDLEIRQF